MMNNMFKRFAAIGMSAVMALSAVGTALAADAELAVEDETIVVSDVADTAAQDTQDVNGDVIQAVAQVLAASQNRPSSDSAFVPLKTKVRLNTKELHLLKGSSSRLTLSGTKKKVKWSTDKKSVATVSSKGKVTAKKKGTATITAKVGKKRYICEVIVTNDMAVSKSSVNLRKNLEQTIRLTLGQNLTASDVQIKNSDDRIVSVTAEAMNDGTDSNVVNITLKGLVNGVSTLKISNAKTKEVLKVHVKVTGIENPGRAKLIGYIQENGRTLTDVLADRMNELAKALSDALGEKVTAEDVEGLLEALGDFRIYTAEVNGCTQLMLYISDESEGDLDELLAFASVKNGSKSTRIGALLFDDEDTYAAGLFAVYSSGKRMFVGENMLYRPDFSENNMDKFDLTRQKISEATAKKVATQIAVSSMTSWEQMLNTAGTSFSEFGFLNYPAQTEIQ